MYGGYFEVGNAEVKKNDLKKQKDCSREIKK